MESNTILRVTESTVFSDPAAVQGYQYTAFKFNTSHTIYIIVVTDSW